ncbi:terminase small subunit [Faecalibacterium prausnitzii]|uniref:terminase small subunit n=1 Tax=Faecalibacterium prausnitzii TaxID=853 RepID=UPI003C2D0D4F
MPRAKNAKAEVARKLYEQGILLKDIAEQLDVPQGTIRRWKSTYKWDQSADCSDVRKENERSVNSERSEKKKVQRVKHDVASVTENPELTDKQRLFCLYYVRCFNATKAYQKAYGCSYEAAVKSGSRMLTFVDIRTEIQSLKQSRLNRELLDEHDIFQKYMDIAFADITDFVQFGQEEEYVIGQFGLVQVEDPVTGKKAPLKQKVNTVRFRESDSIDGTLITEVKNGKNGASIKLADRMKALEWLAEHMDIATEEQKARIAVLKMKSAGDEPEDIDTSYVDALKDLAAKVWTNEEEKD